MLNRSGKNWILDFFVSRGWLSKKRRRLRSRADSWGFHSTVPAECLESRTLLSTITVTGLTDGTTPASGVTLRDAIQAANTDTSVNGSVAGEAGVQNVIVFQPGLTGKITLTPALGALTISSTMKIEGLGAPNTLINAGVQSRVFDITSGAGNVELDDLTVINGKTTGNSQYGGGIRFLSSGTLTLANSAVTFNYTSGSSSPGAAIYTQTGNLAILDSTISNNVTSGAGSSGGAIFSQSGTVTISNSTISGNKNWGDSSDGAALYTLNASASVTLTNCTVSANKTYGTNSDGGAITVVGGSVTLANSIVSGNHVGVGNDADVKFVNFDGSATFAASHSLVGVNSGTPLGPAAVGSPDANGNLVGTAIAPLDAKLGALANNGGPTQTMALLAGSPAMNAGNNPLALDTNGSPLATDERGAPFQRVFGAAVDIGAFEAQSVNLVVTSAADQLDALYDPAHLTLRDALFLTNASSGANTIAFSSSISGTTINLTLGTLVISTPVAITGNGAKNTTINAQQQSRVFYLGTGSGNVSLSGMTITGGETSGNNSYGAGILDDSTGTLTVTNSTITGNVTTGFVGRGAGIFSNSGPVVLLDSTISYNSTTGKGGDGAGIASQHAPLSLTNCTVTGNTTSGYHGQAVAIYTFYADGSITLTNSTVANNFNNGSDTTEAAVFALRGSMTLLNSIVSGNTISRGTSTDVGFANYSHSATFISRNSLIGNNSGTPLAPAPAGSPDANGNLVGTFASPLNPKLGPLAYNGGPTQTMALLAGSPAIDAGSSSLALAPDSTPLTTDQRGSGFPRVNNGTVDMGAFEIRQILTDTTPVTTLTAVAGNNTGNVVLATFKDEIPPVGLLSYISVPGASSTNVTGVSGSVVVGNFTSPAGHGYLYNGTTFTTLDFPGAVATEVRAFSGSNVVGFYLDTGNEYHGFLYNSLTASYTSIDPSGSIHTGARAVSGNIIAGDYYDASQVQRGFVYNILTSTYTTFAVPGATASSTSIVGISGDNVVGSYIDDAGGAIHGFLYNTLTSSSTTLDPSGSIATNATGISGSNVVGYFLDAEWVYHGFLYNSLTSSYTTIDPPGSIYTGVRTISGNNVAGEYQDASHVQRGFVYNILTTTYTTFAVPAAAADTTSVTAINGGNVVGYYNDASGYEQGYLYQMSPVQSDFTPTVNWGGTLVGTPTVSVQLVSQSATGSTWEVVGSATFANAGNFTTSVTVSDATGASVQTTNTQFSVQSSNSNASAAFSFTGEYAVSSTGSNTVTLASITQNGDQLTLNGTSVATATVVASPAQLLMNGAVVATYANSALTFTSGTFAGQTWTKLDLPTNFTNQSGAAVQVITNGASISFVNKFGATTPASWTSPTTLFLSAWNESVTTGLGTLTFQDGSIWSMKLALNGTNNGTGTTAITAAPSTLYVFDYMNQNGKPVHLIQTGTNSVLFIFANNVFGSGQFISPMQLTTPVAPNDIATISNDFSTITWQDGYVWTQTAPTGTVTLTNATNAHGLATHLVQNGSTQVALIDCLGNIIIGNQVNPGQYVTALYGPGDLATVSGNTVTWQDGSIWTPQGGAVPVTVTLTDQNGAAFHVRLTSSSSLIAVDGVMAGLSATRLNGKLFWSNGVVWNGFDLTGLNALFEMTTGYP